MTSSALNTTKPDYPIGEFRSSFDGSEPFLADHIIQGKKILPGMAYLEIARAAVAHSVNPDDQHIVVLQDSVFVNALTVTDKARDVVVTVFPGGDGEFGVEVSTDQGIHFQSKALVVQREAYLREQALPNRVEVAEWLQRCQKPGPTQQVFYATFLKRGVKLGPSHRGVNRIQLGEGCGVVDVALPGASRRGMVMDPGMLDSIIQGGVALSDNPEANVVPFAVRRTVVLRALPDRVRVLMAQTDQGLVYTAVDDDGAVCVIVDGFMTREIDLSAGEARLQYFGLDWQGVPATSATPSLAVQATGDYQRDLVTLLDEAKKLADQKSPAPLLEVQIEESNSAARGLHAALKTLSLEYPKWQGRVKYNGQVQQLLATPLEKPAGDTFQWPAGKAVLLTGGLGGVGRLIAEDIARSGRQCELILVGRKAVDTDQQQFMSQLASHGARVHYAQCDISVAAQVEALVKQYPNIAGVIHGSGVLRDNYLQNKSSAEVAAVLAPKVKGIENLDRCTAALPLEFFVALSSIAAVLGNAGQLDYAAANAYMDAFMHRRAAQVKTGERRGKSLSINWPLWESAGMQMDAASRAHLQQTLKIDLLPSDQGVQALKQCLAGEHVQVAVIYGNKKAATQLMQSLLPKSASAKPKKDSKADKPEHEVIHFERSKLQRAIAQEVRQQTAEHLKREASQLDDSADWSEFGFDSILMSSFVNRMNARFDLTLMPTVMFEASNMQLISQYLVEHHAEHLAKKLALGGIAKARVAAPSVAETEDPHNAQFSSFAQSFKKAYRTRHHYRDRDVAIIGMSCRIAGARTLEEFWQVLDGERDMVSEIPADRWNWRDYPGVRKWGSFVDGAAEFDPFFFSISPTEANYMAPEQRLMMQYVWECVEIAGYNVDDLRGSDMGLFIGCGPSGYSHALSKVPIEAYSATGMVPSVGPNRISYAMDWHGPSNPIETACSSALVAIHRAVEAMRLGHCSQAIAGGVNLLLSPDGYISFSKSGMLAEDGRCKTFSDQANGYVRGEGVAMLLLKPLPAAIADGDEIYAVVKGTAENHGGRTSSLTAPNPKSQAAVIKKALADAQVDFRRVGYIECHGTGTSLGDPVEITGLKLVAEALTEGGDNSEHRCRLGSIKSNIGHLEYAAGGVGVVKAVLQMRHKKIARSLHCDAINPYIDLRGTPFEIAQQACEWPVAEGERRVTGVSSFGFGGVNAHVVLEEYVPAPQAEPEDVSEQPRLLVVSAQNASALKEYLQKLLAFSSDLDNIAETFKRLANTLQSGRMAMPERVAFVASSLAQWRSQLEAVLQGKPADESIFRGSVTLKNRDVWEHYETEEGQAELQQLITTGDLRQLASLWTQGAKIDWSLLQN